MAKEATTISADLDRAAFLAAVDGDERRAEAERLLTIFAEETGWEPRLWGRSIIGFGRYAYRYDSGHGGESLATGFAPRKAELSVYIMPGFADFGDILARLGPHRMGKSCLYLRRLSAVEEGVLRELIQAGLNDLATRWPVHPVQASVQQDAGDSFSHRFPGQAADVRRQAGPVSVLTAFLPQDVRRSGTG